VIGKRKVALKVMEQTVLNHIDIFDRRK